MRTKYMFCEVCNTSKTTRDQQRNKLCKKCANDLNLEQFRKEASLPNRLCKKCLTEKPNTAEFFYYHTKKHNRLKTICKSCDNSRKTLWNEENIESKNLNNRKSYHKNKQQISDKRKLKRIEDSSVRDYHRKYYKEKTSKIPAQRIRKNISKRKMK